MISVSKLILGLISIALVIVGFTYHLGWRHGWEVGLASGAQVDPGEEKQPRVKHILGLIYALGWHKGWDHGFREAIRKTASGENGSRE